MSLLTPIALVAITVLLTPVLTRLLGRATGWPLAALYLAAAATLAPSAAVVLDGGRPTWSAAWVPGLGVDLALALDGLGVVFSVIALVIGAAVFAYSTRYLEVGRQLSFYLVMTLFTFAMLGLVMADDLVVLFICWELTSLASFLLIARSGHSAEGASMRTLLLTFVGGIFLICAVALTWWRVGSTSLPDVFASDVWAVDPGFTALVAALVALAAFTKSAQFPFHSWLPDAMAAITPVSAYLHAAAVVKAGIFLLLRFSPLFHDVPVWNLLVISGGVVTTFVGGWFALQQTDLKRLMAYSTVSQLGLVVATIGIGTEAALAAAILHVIAHAMFKSGLFMMVGVVDHAVHTRDLRRMPPRLYRSMPVTFALTVLGCLAMAGVPPTLGFVSKEAILAAVRGAPGADWTGWAVLILVALSAVLTFAYCTRIVLGAFVDGPDTDREVGHSDPALVATAGLPILASAAAVVVLPSLDRPVAVATHAAYGTTDAAPHFALWHGVNLELMVTLAVLAAGVALALARRRFYPWVDAHPFPVDGPAVIGAAGEAARRAGVGLNRIVARDTAARHLAPVLGGFAVVGLAGAGVVARGGLPPTAENLNRPIDLVLVVLMAAAVFAVCTARSRIAAVVGLSAVGILATVQILALGAPDVAMTQLLVESLSIIVMMLVLQKLPLQFAPTPPRRRAWSLAVAVGAGAAMAALVWVLNGRRDRSDLAEYFLANTYDEAGGTNVVNIILVEFRALDTLGELSVLGMAGVAIIAVLSTVRDRYLDPPPPDHSDDPDPAAGRAARGEDPDLPLRADPASSAHRAIHVAWPNAVGLQLMLRLAVPVLLVISALLFWRGHNEPGGGFNAALVASAAVGLMYLSTSKDRQIGPPRLPLYLIGGGILTGALTGVLGLVTKGSFLQPIHGYLGDVHLTTSMIFDVGVYTAVLGLILVSFNLLGTSESRGDGEGTRERTDELSEGELAGPLETVRGEPPAPGDRAEDSGRRVGRRTQHVAQGTAPQEVGR